MLLHIVPAFHYGHHYPQGIAAVDYVYSSEGTWKHLNPAEYEWNYYSQYATPNHPYDKDALVAYANGTKFTTCRDANGHLLLDFNKDGEIDVSDGGWSFHEHNGKGRGGQARGNPFTNFWFDDNWLCRAMSRAYGRQQPNGLLDYDEFVRWRVIEADTRDWSPYPHPNSYVDQLALNGMYYLAEGRLPDALFSWNRIVNRADPTYDVANQRYNYKVYENYHLGLWLILSSLLLNENEKDPNIIQHLISARSHLLSNQEVTYGGLWAGWTSSTNDDDSLMNSESIACGALGLAAGAIHVFEAGRKPLSWSDRNYFLRKHNVLSAVKDLSNKGNMTWGPLWNYPKGTYYLSAFLRAPNPQGHMATIEVIDEASGEILASKNVMANDMAVSNNWEEIKLSFIVTAGINPTNRLSFNTHWEGTENMDISHLRLTA